MDSQLLEINLISAQSLKPPFRLRHVQAYAVAWVEPAFKVRTLVDRTGGENPTWNDKFIFRVPSGFLANDSTSTVAVEIYAAAGRILPDPLLGTVRLLVGNLRLLSRRRDCPAFDAVGIRRPSGRFHGVLNVGATILRCVSLVAAKVLATCPAVSYRDLMGKEASKIRRFPATPAAAARRVDPTAGKDPAPKEWNGGKGSADCEDEEERSDGGVVLCGPCFLGLPRRIHLSPSDQNLKLSWTEEKPADDGRP
ncbi:uncharacterized protein [Elaeis guineensis]|uniref:Uncharacterized protein LOC105039856 n=1 Tax=Elaeis guineensis var. tenera TaxID=51953 RepID=A0A6I9QSA1_ELAGV|nr:uncharacterized protein LOC105039856 [Elaeis guineensis]